MPKRRAARRAAAERTQRGLTSKLVLAALALYLIASGLTWAGWGRLAYRKAEPYGASPPAAPMPAPPVQVGFSPASPSKEYVYAGGRLVATEEPPPGPANLRYVQTGQSSSATTGYLQWDDTTENETAFVIESQQCSPGCTAWAQHGQAGQNVTTYNLPPLTSPPTYKFRVKAIIPSGSTGYSNEVEMYFSSGGCWTTIRNGKKVTFCTGTSSCTTPTTLIISEFRLRGAAGAKDEFVELYNNSDSAITVCTSDSSGGWTLAARTASGASASPVFTVPNGTVIPPRGHYLGVNASPAGGYSLSQHPAGNGTTATGDMTYTTDIEDNSGLALFKTANPANFNAANRLDAAGFNGAAGAIPDLYREGGGLGQIGTQDGQYSFYRTITSASGYYPKDTNDNASDFLLVSAEGSLGGNVVTLGAPGPENLSSPARRDSVMSVALLDPAVNSSTPPNRARTLAMGDPSTSIFGTMSMRRKVTNYSGSPVTRIRFRVVEITTYPSSGLADLRAISSGPVQVTLSSGQLVTVQGTVMDEPPSLARGGGYNSAMTLQLPQPLAPGESASFQLMVGLMNTGSFRFIVSVEALP